MSAYDGMTDAEVAHAVLSFLRLGYRHPRGGSVARGPCPYPIRGGDGLTAASALLDESKGYPLVLVEAVGPRFTDASVAAAAERTRKIAVLASRISWGRSPMPEVWLCVPAPALEDLRARFPDMPGKWVAYQI